MVRRMLLVLSVMAVMLAGTVGTALAQAQRGPCKESVLVEGVEIPLNCRQGVLLPEEPKGNTENPNVGFNGYGQASNSCKGQGYGKRLENAPHSFDLGGQAPENVTSAFARCFPGPLPIET